MFTLRLFGLDPTATRVAELLEQHGSFELLAWYGDALLARFITELLWAKVSTDSQATISTQSLHDTRVRYTSNATLACFLRNATDIEHPTASSDHALGTLFEFMLCLLQRSKGDVAAAAAVRTYRSWVRQHAELVAAAHASFDRIVPVELAARSA